MTDRERKTIKREKQSEREEQGRANRADDDWLINASISRHTAI